MWFLAGHPVRGFLGMLVLRQLPKTHEIAEDVDLDDIRQEEMSVEKLASKMKFDLSIQFMLRAGESKNWMLFYSMATGLVYIFDLLTFCVAFYQFQGVVGYEHTDVIMLFATILWLGIDVYYFMWVMSLKNKLPPDMACFVSDAVLGYAAKMNRELKYNLDPADRAKVDDAKNKLAQKQNTRNVEKAEVKDAAKAKAAREKELQASQKAQGKA